MTRFRPCIDLHAGQVKQIVGGTLDSDSAALKTNFVSHLPPAHFAKLYRDNALAGAHVIMLGPGNTEAAKEALAAWPGGLQVGGALRTRTPRSGSTRGGKGALFFFFFSTIPFSTSSENNVIITSYLFPDGKFSQERLDAVLRNLDNDKSKLVIDLSCRKTGSRAGMWL
ncbi:unnamed protein product [Parascedosporium putredinis]|uniref:Phosphoribosylformimino-5-aminoimidazole carboxamide ribotide isomerase n=1 Tax=Parascedosporium putredinis TaxID=1442378 RepID=A0A9P1GX58_9PEZI|nr:unnamed protein product [Parascedosporium putredinis]CAI7988721.1 unnamed protein product [Parascedosporium putredinis]